MTMTGRQRTFELVPTTLVKQNAAKPPMTSKAAKKAYQQAQKGPRISKAEQRRRDAEEYERIRKEHEKEKNAAKSKAAREKKAAKALAEKEGRKKLGLPEPSRFVRASQPTISKFIRADSSAKRSWKEMNVIEETEDLVSDSEGEDRDEALPSAKRVAIEHESEDEFGDFPLLSPSALDKIDSSAASFSAPPSPEKKQLYEAPLNRNQPLQERQKERTSGETPKNKDIVDIASTRVLSEAVEKASKEYASEPSAFPPPLPVIVPRKLPDSEVLARPLDSSDYENRVAKSVTMPPPKNIPTSNTRPVLQERSNNMPPPRLPVKKPSISFASPPVRPERSRQNNPSVLSRTTPNTARSATQAFLEDHLDDFFPSPSQQVRELLDDIEDIPSNTQIAKEIGPQKPNFNDQSDYFICTQDFVLTPQDLEEIVTPSRAQPKATMPAASVDVKPPSLRPVSRDKPRFFEEKEEDLFQAALHESRSPRSRRTQRGMSIATPEPQIPTVQSKPQSRRFFEEKEEDLVKAAMHESKISAAKQGRLKKAFSPPLLRKESSTTDYGNFDFGGFFEDEEQKALQAAERKMLQAAIEESKKTAGLEKQAVHVKGPSKRSLKRALSSATDYGEDELKGCSQELLALC
jgi:hypothetical protein